MAAFEINGIPLTSLGAGFPRVGVWYVDVITTNVGTLPIVVGAGATVKLGDLTCVGTAVRAGQARGSEYVRVVGGAGRLGETVSPQGFRSATWWQIATAILGDVGETLSATVNPVTLPALFLPTDLYALKAEAASKAIDRVARAVGAIWRVLPDGTVWIGNDTWQKAALTNATFMDASPEQAQSRWGIEVPQLLPGTTLPASAGAELVDGRVGYVEYSIDPDTSRMRVLYGDGDHSPVAQPLADAVDNLTAPLDYQGSYPATVVLRQADGTFDLLPDDATLPGLQGIPVRTPSILPWSTAPLPPALPVLTGSKVTLAFENGDPSKPYIAGADAGTINFSAAAAVLTISYLPPGGGAPQTVLLTFTSATPVVVSGGGQIKLTAVG